MNCASFIEALVDQGHKVYCSPAVLLLKVPRGDITHLGCAQGRDNWESLCDTFPSQLQTASRGIGDKICVLRNPHIIFQVLMEWGEIVRNQCQSTLPPRVLWISMPSSAVSIPGCHKGSNSGKWSYLFKSKILCFFLNLQQLQQTPTEEHLYKLLIKRNFYGKYRRRKISIFPANQMKTVTTM